MHGPIFKSRRRPLLFAHRGDSAHAPENTMPAFDLAVRLGADVLELDVHMSVDGEVVVLHDATLDRTTTGTGLVRTKTFAELRALDAGAHFVTPGGERPFADRNVEIPRLLDVLQAFPKMAFNIEIKQADPPMLDAFYDVLNRAGISDVLLAAASHQVMETLEAHSAGHGLALGLSAQQAMAVVRAAYWGKPIQKAWRGRALQIPPWYKVVPVATKRLIACAHKAGLEVHLWTLNTATHARKYLDRGVDGIMSDDPGAVGEAFVATDVQLRRQR